jgi:hypothetical protein
LGRPFALNDQTVRHAAGALNSCPPNRRQSARGRASANAGLFLALLRGTQPLSSAIAGIADPCETDQHHRPGRGFGDGVHLHLRGVIKWERVNAFVQKESIVGERPGRVVAGDARARDVGGCSPFDDGVAGGAADADFDPVKRIGVKGDTPTYRSTLLVDWTMSTGLPLTFIDAFGAFS